MFPLVSFDSLRTLWAQCNTKFGLQGGTFHCEPQRRMNGDIITIFDVARDSNETYRIRITFFRNCDGMKRNKTV